ncbi:maleylacetoacetate isomerase [Parazoarcus communis]|uniref:maleylacetoacetate isomerase n=1 Tax=Parazoarcus communis TaxID=41977 RepID=UPI00190263DD|nr:maleylacetoacetate isomerase [Parazoarcus communis]
MTIHNFFRSGTSHRLRIALNLKEIEYEYVAVDLRTEAHLGAAFKAVNPQQLVPALVDGDLTLIQSPAIIEWLEERHPAPALLPSDPDDRARVRAMAAIVGCDVHPINNRRILEYLRKTLGCDEAAVLAWCNTWITAGFDALETMLAADTRRGSFCFGNAPSLADVYLVPQVESARRFNVDLTPYPNIVAVDRACAELEAFRLAAPGVQPDAPGASPPEQDLYRHEQQQRRQT